MDAFIAVVDVTKEHGQQRVAMGVAICSMFVYVEKTDACMCHLDET